MAAVRVVSCSLKVSTLITVSTFIVVTVSMIVSVFVHEMTPTWEIKRKAKATAGDVSSNRFSISEEFNIQIGVRSYGTVDLSQTLLET